MSTSTSPAPRKMLWGTLLVPCTVFCGLIAGIVTARFSVSETTGFEAVGIAFTYGLLGAFFAGLLSALLIWRSSPRFLRGAALTAFALASICAVVIAWGLIADRAERRAAAGLDQPLPPPAGFVLEAALSELDTTRSYRELEIDGHDWSFRWVAVGPEAAVCRGRLVAAEAEKLYAQLQSLERRFATSPPPCASETEPVIAHLAWRPQPGPGATPFEARELEITRTCLREEDEVAALAYTLRRIPLDAVSYARAACD